MNQYEIQESADVSAPSKAIIVIMCIAMCTAVTVGLAGVVSNSPTSNDLKCQETAAEIDANKVQGVLVIFYTDIDQCEVIDWFSKSEKARNIHIKAISSGKAMIYKPILLSPDKAKEMTPLATGE